MVNSDQNQIHSIKNRLVHTDPPVDPRRTHLRWEDYTLVYGQLKVGGISEQHTTSSWSGWCSVVYPVESTVGFFDTEGAAKSAVEIAVLNSLPRNKYRETLFSEPFLPDELINDEPPTTELEQATTEWSAKMLRCLAAQLTIRNDFYYPLLGIAQHLELESKMDSSNAPPAPPESSSL